jgi:hypothetical protein
MCKNGIKLFPLIITEFVSKIAFQGIVDKIPFIIRVTEKGWWDTGKISVVFVDKRKRRN